MVNYYRNRIHMINFDSDKYILLLDVNSATSDNFKALYPSSNSLNLNLGTFI